MREQPKSIFDVITEHKDKALVGAEHESVERILALRDELKPHLARVDAMEKKLEAITTAVEMQMTVRPDDREECSVCGTVDEHTPDCFVATLKYILATPEEPTSTDNVTILDDNGNQKPPVKEEGVSMSYILRELLCRIPMDQKRFPEECREAELHVTRYEAMEKVIREAIDHASISMGNVNIQCRTCNKVCGEHVPECFVGKLEAALAMPVEAKTEDKDYGTINGPVNSDGPITAETSR